MSDEVNDYAARLSFDNWQVDHMPDGYLRHTKEQIERDAIYKAVKQASGWIMVKPEWREVKDPLGTRVEYTFVVHARAVQTEKMRVYVFDDYQTAMMRNPAIPKDLYFCEYCGGRTKNDMRGHCAACGGPRKSYKWDR